jgi:AcrR family transcriptional regulator
MLIVKRITPAYDRRMRKGQVTRNRIVEEAARQGSIRGLAAVSLNDVAEAVGLSKSGVFKHFDAKEGLHHAVLEATVQRYLDVIWAPAVKLPQGPERLTLIFDRWLDWVENEAGPGGCLIMQASVEFDDQPGPLRDYLRTCHLRWQKTIVGEIRALRDPPLSDETAQQGAFDLKSYVLGFAEQRRLLDDAAARRRARSAFDRWLRDIVSEPALA